MSYQILAATCQHPIRISNYLPRSGTLLDFDVRYCTHCEASRSIRHDREHAERNYQSRLEAQQRMPSSGNRAAYVESRRNYDQSRLAYAEDAEYQQERDDRERRAQGRPTLREEGRRFAGLDDPRLVEFGSQIAGREMRRTRFAEPESYRRESQYRDQGYGYQNTSDPYASSSSEEGADADLNAMSNEQLHERIRRLQEVQARFRR
ncbi:hypothetical protein LTR08_003458 [Meristemomyces frigidus]|nr:hypothetical protein LTR08_003458 [Meristemomyces frigidus]